jgi:formylglycine-generating enzyme required for sulfatase activity
MGSPVTEKGHDKGETQHQRRIPYTFAIAAHEVTIEQYFRYHPNSVPVDKGTPIQAPAFGVTWFNAAGYCNWLSRRENIPRDQWCYEYGPSNQVGAGMTIKPDALKLAGYRLPTEGEWEYACRAGTGTSRYYGESNRLLRHYAWYSVYSVDENPLQVGSLLPNSLGLFDMHGNAAEWTQNRGGLSKSRSNAVPSEDEIASDAIYNDTHFIYRSGGYLNPASDVRSAKRASAEAGERFRHLGFRVVRTIPATDSKK